MKTIIALLVGMTVYSFAQQNDSVKQQLSYYKEAYQSLLIADEQSQTGNLIGTVIDAVVLTPIEKSVVEIIGTDKSVVIGKDGQYKISDVPKGFYQIRASAKGYISETINNIDIGNRPEQLVFFKLKMNPTDPPDFVPVDVQPQPISSPAPKYPELGRKLRMEGEVWIKLLVAESGDVSRIEVLRFHFDRLDSIGMSNTFSGVEKKKVSDETYKVTGQFVEATKSAAIKWKFSPAKINNENVKVWVSIPFKFKLDSPHKEEKKSKK